VINSRFSHELAVNGALFLDTSTKAEIPDDGGLFNQQKPTNRWSISLYSMVGPNDEPNI